MQVSQNIRFKYARSTRNAVGTCNECGYGVSKREKVACMGMGCRVIVHKKCLNGVPSAFICEACSDKKIDTHCLRIGTAVYAKTERDTSACILVDFKKSGSQLLYVLDLLDGRGTQLELPPESIVALAGGNVDYTKEQQALIDSATDCPYIGPGWKKSVTCYHSGASVGRKKNMYHSPDGHSYKFLKDAESRQRAIEAGERDPKKWRSRNRPHASNVARRVSHDYVHLPSCLLAILTCSVSFFSQKNPVGEESDGSQSLLSLLSSELDYGDSEEEEESEGPKRRAPSARQPRKRTKVPEMVSHGSLQFPTC